MFDYTPTQLAQFSLVSQIGGMFSSAVGNYYSSQNLKSNLKFQADMASINARLSETSAQQEMLKGDREVGAVTLRAGQMKSSQRAAMAANGIDLGEGNAAEVQASTDIMKEIDKNTITANAVRSAWGYRTQGVGYQNDALMKSASASGVNPIGSAASSLLGSAGGVASSWYMMNKVGAFDSPSTGGIGGGTGLSMGGGQLGLDLSRSGLGLRY